MSIAAIVGTIAVVMLVKENKDDGGATPPVVTTEAGITETLATPDIAETEESTEEVVEDTEDYAYIDEYARILQENSAAIQAYETFSGLYSEPEKTVAIIDAFSDTTPELFFITSDYPNYQSEEGGALNVYTMVDGKAVFVKKDTFQSVAGSAQPNKVFTSKSKEAFYWEYVPSHGVGETSDITDKIGYNIVSAQTEEHSLIYDHSWDEEQTGKQERNTYLIDGAETDEASYQSAKAGWEADYGDIIFDNWDRYSTNGGATVTYDMGDEFLSDFYDVTQNAGNNLLEEEFMEKYHITMMMPTGTGCNFLSTDSYDYAYYDINHDGIDELIIEYGAIISFKNGTPTALNALTDANNVSIRVLENGHIVISGQGVVWAPQIAEYELADDGISLIFIDGVNVDGNDGKYYKIGSNGENLQELTEEEYNLIVDGMVENQTITYIPLKNFK